MMHLNPSLQHLIMPPDCVKTKLAMPDSMEGMGVEFCKSSAAEMTKPGENVHSDSICGSYGRRTHTFDADGALPSDCLRAGC